MKEGRSINDLAVAITYENRAKQDYTVAENQLRADEHGNVWFPYVDETEVMVRPNSFAHHQVAAQLEIPYGYYNRVMQDNGPLWADNVNHWLSKSHSRRLLRTFNTKKLRAYLSERYLCLDNYELLETVLPHFSKMPEMRIASCEVTEQRLYLKIVNERIKGSVVGDVVQAGIVIENSEVGAAAFSIRPAIYMITCTNLAIADIGAMRRIHIGRVTRSDEEIAHLLSEATRQLDSRAFFSKVNDVVTGAFNPESFQLMVQKMIESRGREIQAAPAIENLVTTKRVNQAEGEGILDYLVKGGDLTRYGLGNAVTRYSQDVEDYDRATELEVLGGRILLN